jgi:hypothetical protein
MCFTDSGGVTNPAGHFPAACVLEDCAQSSALQTSIVGPVPSRPTHDAATPARRSSMLTMDRQRTCLNDSGSPFATGTRMHEHDGSCITSIRINGSTPVCSRVPDMNKRCHDHLSGGTRCRVHNNAGGVEGCSAQPDLAQRTNGFYFYRESQMCRDFDKSNPVAKL